MDDYIIEQFYGESVKVRLFVYDLEVPEHSSPQEMIRTVKLAGTIEPSGHLIENFASDTVYFVPLSNSLYFSPNFTDYEIIGTVKGPEGLEIYCDFYAAFEPDEAIEMLVNEGWSIEFPSRV